MRKVVVGLLLIGGFLGGLCYVLAEEASESKEVVEVTVNKLHLRTGIGTNFPPIHILKKGAKLAVVREKLGWLEVRLPAGTPCWIAKKLVEVKDENKGIVKGNRVNVRFETDFKSRSIIGQVRESQELNIIGEGELWYKITPPENLTGWVSKKYTRYWGDIESYEKWLAGEETKKAEAERLAAELKELFKKAEEIYTEQKVKPRLEQNFSEALEIYRRIVSQSSDKEMIAISKERFKELEWRVEALNRYSKAISEMLTRHQEADRERNRRLAELSRPEVAKKPYDATGLVDYVGKFYRRPGTHRLIKGGQTLFFLKSDTINLDDCYNKQIGVWGKIVENKGWLQKTIIVEDIKILGKKELIEE